MNEFAKTPETPYYAVIFTSVLVKPEKSYAAMADKMVQLAKTQPGFLGIESARADIGITVSYWRDLESIKLWKQQSEHLVAQTIGKSTWYKAYTVRIAKVEKAYSFFRNDG